MGSQLVERLRAAVGARQPANGGLQRAVVGVLVYVGVMSLGILMLRVWEGIMARAAGLAAIRGSMWLSHGGAAQLRWSVAVVGILLVLYLWACWRSPSRHPDRLVTLQYLGASLLVLLLQWALVVTLRGAPRYDLVQLFP
jgi:hypothetical protein